MSMRRTTCDHSHAAAIARICAAGMTVVLAGCTPSMQMAQLVLPVTGATAKSMQTYPVWAYLWEPDAPRAPVDDLPQHVPASAANFSIRQSRDLFITMDWHPEDHPPMPRGVAQG